MSRRAPSGGRRRARALLIAAAGLVAQGCAVHIFHPKGWPETHERRVVHLTRLAERSVRDAAGGELTLPPLPEDARTVRPEEAGAPAVILVDERTVSFGTGHPLGAHTVVEVRRAVRLDTRSAADAAQVRLVFDSYDLLHGLIAETQTADGRTIPVEETQTFDLTRYYKSPPDRALVFAFPHAGPGSIVRWAYRIRLPGWRPVDAWRAPEGVPVREAVYRMRAPKAVKIRYRSQGLKMATGQSGDMIVREWTARDLPFEPLLPGDARPPGGRAGLRLTVTDGSKGPVIGSWGDLLREMHSRALSPRPRLPQALTYPAPGEGHIEAAWRRVHDHLADGVTPLPARMDDFEALAHYRRATADDRAELLYGTLRSWGVDCRLIYTSRHGAPPVDPEFPMPAAGDRLLVSCKQGADSVLLDPGCSGCAPGQIGADVRGRPALVFDRGAGPAEPMTLPADPAPPVERRYTVELSDRGLVARTGEVVLHDTDAARVRAWLRDHPLPPEQAAEDAGEVFLDGIEATRIGVSGHEADAGPVRFALENVLISRGAFARGARWATVPLDVVFGEPVLTMAGVEARRRPVVLTGAMGFVNGLHLPAGEGWAVVRSPEPTVIESPYGTYRLERAAEGGLTLTERLELIPGVVSAEDWPALRDFFARVAAHRRDPTVLRRDPAKKVAAAE